MPKINNTGYAETNALFAAMDDDEREMLTLLRVMTKYERRSLHTAARLLAWGIERVNQEKP